MSYSKKNPGYVQSVGLKDAAEITPDDTDFIPETSGLYVGVSGDVAVTMASGRDVTFKDLSAGEIHPISVTKVKATGTTADDILAVY